MENVTLKRKLSSYVTDKGYLKHVPDDILFEVLIAWENWTGSSKEFYASLGFSHRQMASLIGKAKRLKREGHFGDEDFKQLKISPEQSLIPESPTSTTIVCGAAEIVLPGGKLIRFSNIDFLVDYLKKIA
jgi:hypothetical protein